MSKNRSAPGLIVAVSSRALFDFEDENRVFEAQGEAAYRRAQWDKIEVPAKPGVACRLVRKLLALNGGGGGEKKVEVAVLSRNDPFTGMRVFHSASELDLSIARGVFTRGRAPYPYLSPLGAHLFLSANDADVKSAIESGVPAAHIFRHSDSDSQASGDSDSELRIVFDGDAVLFGDEAERVYAEKGIDAFTAHEKKNRNKPLSAGPFEPFLRALHRLQKNATATAPRIRTALMTARGAPAHERQLRTLVKWGVEIDEAFFLSGAEKKEFIRAFRPDFFFDDQPRHLIPAADCAPVGHVDFGIRNRPPSKPKPTAATRARRKPR